MYVDIIDRLGCLVGLLEGGVGAGLPADQAGGVAGGVRLVAWQTGTPARTTDGVGAGPAVRATANHSGLAAT